MVRQLVGAVLVLIAVIASAPAFLLSFAMIAVVGGVLDTKSSSPTLEASSGTIAAIWVVSIVLAFGCGRVGVGLVRGNRRLVLFLRRFGFDDATGAVSYAIASSLGPSWRLVTLDDDEVAPIGVPESAKRVLGLVSFGSRTVDVAYRVYRVGARLFPWMLVAIAAIVVADAIGKPDFWGSLLDSVLAHLKLVLVAIDSRELPHPLGWNVESAFLVMSGIVVLVLVGMFALFPILLLLVIMAVPFTLVSGTIDSMRKAETMKEQVISDPAAMAARAYQIAHQGGRFFAPRLTVIRVDPRMWHEAVLQLAEVSSAILVDISDPTRSLLWEIETLKGQNSPRFVVIGEHDRVRELAEPSPTASNEVDDRIADALRGQRVLAYTMDRRGLRRFAGALRDRFETLSGAFEPARRYPLTSKAMIDEMMAARRRRS